MQIVKGAPEWRIKFAPSAPHVGIAAVMNYVRMMSYQTKDLRVKMNAEKTLAQLQELATTPPGLAPQMTGPEVILSQFVEIQMDGKGLNGERADQTDAFLVHPLQWRQDKIGVARAFLVKNDSVVLNKALAHVEYAAIGELDSKLKLTSSSTSGGLVRQDYELLFDDKYVLPGRGNASPDEITGPSRWRIEDAPAEQWISVNAAIRYITQMRDTTTDPVIKDNTEKTLALLSRYR